MHREIIYIIKFDKHLRLKWVEGITLIRSLQVFLENNDIDWFQV